MRGVVPLESCFSAVFRHQLAVVLRGLNATAFGPGQIKVQASDSPRLSSNLFISYKSINICQGIS